jgi:thiol-disulfide isomerase/thioredoxin
MRTANEDTRRSASRARRILSIAATTLALVAIVPATRLSAQDMGIELGTRGPGAAVETLDGKPADLSQFVGKTPVLIEFWATWCGNCRELEPHVKAMHAKYGAQVQFLAVAVSVNQSAERVKAYVEKHGVPGTHFFDRKGTATGAYDVPATSYVVVLDKSGKVVYTGLGGDQDLEKAIKKAL